MGLFGNSEEKQAQKEQKEQEKLQKMLSKYGLQTLKDPQDIESVRNIVADLGGTGWMELGNFVAPDQKTVNQLMIQYQRTIIEQNFIIIRQLDKIANK